MSGVGIRYGALAEMGGGRRGGLLWGLGSAVQKPFFAALKGVVVWQCGCLLQRAFFYHEGLLSVCFSPGFFCSLSG